MQDITITIDESKLAWAKNKAAELDCPVERFLGHLVEEKMRQELGCVDALKAWTNLHVQAQPISYPALNAKQKENYNFHKVAAVLAEFGFTSIRLSDDWKGADFLALHKDGVLDLKVQLKGVYTLNRDYSKKDLWICFRHAITGRWYLYPHDEALQWAMIDNPNLANTVAWQQNGLWTNGAPSKALMAWLNQFAIPLK